MEGRGKHFTPLEKGFFVDIVENHKSVIENKRTDGVNAAIKEKEWDIITEEFNSW